MIDHAHAADEKHGAASGREQQAWNAAAQVCEFSHRHQRVDETVVVRAESLRFALLGVEADDDLHAEQRLDEEAADVGAAVAHAGDRRLEPRAISHQRPERDGHDREAHDETARDRGETG